MTADGLYEDDPGVSKAYQNGSEKLYALLVM